jgi:hypothetical protein
VFKATCFSVMLYFIGLVVILSLGPFGDGPAWLFCFPIITGVLLGYKKAIYIRTNQAGNKKRIGKIIIDIE